MCRLQEKHMPPVVETTNRLIRSLTLTDSTALVVGKVSLEAGKAPVKTDGSYWPYATTLFDYIRRAMPFQDSKSLTDDEVYAVSAYILSLNEIIWKDDVLDAQSLPKVRMPNRDGFIPFPRSPK